MKQLRKTEWQRGYPIKKNLALCAWGLMGLAGVAGIVAHPKNLPSMAACVLALAGAVLTLPRLFKYYRTTYHSLPALNQYLAKKEQEALIEHENFETITEPLQRIDFAESAHWLRIHGRYVPKELVIGGGAEVTGNIMNRDTTPVIFLYVTGDVVKIDLGVQVSAPKIRELNAYLWSCYRIFPGQAGRIKTEELCGICKEVYREYLKEKEPQRQSEVLMDLIEDAQELREKCITRMPSYLKKVDESAWWNAKTRKKMEQWKTERENP